MTSAANSAPLIEKHTIGYVPPEDRHGKVRDLFTLWFGGNIAPLPIVTGALGVQLFHLNLVWAVSYTHLDVYKRQDLGRAHRLARDVRSGIIWVNTYRAVSAMAPIGGFKNSGYGRESGIDSVLAYTELKTVWINLSTAPMPDPFVMR